MTTLNNDGFLIDAQDLATVSPGEDDHQRVFNHDGSSKITLTDDSTASKRGWYMWDNPQGAWFPMGQHADLVDGYHGQDLAAVAEDKTISGAWDFTTSPTIDGTDVIDSDELSNRLKFGNVSGTAGEHQLDFEEQPVSIPMTKWADGLASEEIWRLSLDAGESLEVHRLDVQLKGGGSSSSFSVDVYDVTNSTTLASDTAGGGSTSGDPIGSSGDGTTIVIRITNSTGSYQHASIEGRLHIV